MNLAAFTIESPEPFFCALITLCILAGIVLDRKIIGWQVTRLRNRIETQKMRLSILDPEGRIF